MPQDYRFQILAPAHMRHPSALTRPQTNEQLYDHLLASSQRLRGRAYIKDGAIQPCELDEDGRFRMQGDEQSWHFLLVDKHEEVIGGARYLLHPNTVMFDQLRIRHSALAKDRRWSAKVRAAVEADLALVRREGFLYVEIGGWALSEELRGSRAALETVVASYALGELWGGCVGSCTATVRHGSSSILRRIGGLSFESAGEALPSYEDPQYGCQMELIRFDSRYPAPRFAPFVRQLRATLSNSVAISRGTRARIAWGTAHVGVFQNAFSVPAFRYSASIH